MTHRSPFDSAAWSSPNAHDPRSPRPEAPLPEPPHRPLRERAARALVGLVTGRGSTLPAPVVWLACAAVVLGVGLGVGQVVKAYVVQPFEVPSASMTPTLESGDQIVVEKLSYLLGEPRRGQVVVFDGAGTYDAPDAPQTFYVKRVIAVAGDTVACCDAKGRPVVNGSSVREPYLADGTRTVRFKKVTVPDGEIFVLGDNREDSWDSRYVGTVPVDQVVGHVVARTWPLTRIHTVPVE